MNKIVTSLRHSTVFPYKLQERGLLGRLRNVKLIERDCWIGTEDTSSRERSTLAVLEYVYDELTPWSKAFLQTLTVPQLVKKFHALYGTQRSLTVYARARHLSLSTASWIQSMPHHCDSTMIILWLFHLGISCTVFVLICTVVVLYCFVMCVCVCVCGFCNVWVCVCVWVW